MWYDVVKNNSHNKSQGPQNNINMRKGFIQHVRLQVQMF